MRRNRRVLLVFALVWAFFVGYYIYKTGDSDVSYSVSCFLGHNLRKCSLNDWLGWHGVSDTCINSWLRLTLFVLLELVNVSIVLIFPVIFYSCPDLVKYLHVYGCMTWTHWEWGVVPMKSCQMALWGTGGIHENLPYSCNFFTAYGISSSCWQCWVLRFIPE